MNFSIERQAFQFGNLVLNFSTASVKFLLVGRSHCKTSDSVSNMFSNLQKTTATYKKKIAIIPYELCNGSIFVKHLYPEQNEAVLKKLETGK